MLKINEKLINKYKSKSNNDWKFYISPTPDEIIVTPNYSFILKVVLGSFNKDTKEGVVKSIKITDINGNVIDDPDTKFFVELDGPDGRFRYPINNKIKKESMED